MNQGSDEVKTSNKFCRCRFMFVGSMPTGIKFGIQMMRNVLIYDNYKHSGKGVENIDRSVIIHKGMGT
jgi:hypothetical protein